jgi:hypothetical protein
MGREIRGPGWRSLIHRFGFRQPEFSEPQQAGRSVKVLRALRPIDAVIGELPKHFDFGHALDEQHRERPMIACKRVN